MRCAAINRVSVRELLRCERPQSRIRIYGWVKTRRDAKGFTFLEVNDGSCLRNCQVIVDGGVAASGDRAVTTGAAIAVEGDLVESPGKGQRWEIQATSVELIGACPADYPLQKKRHSDEYLRTIAHLRSRTNKYGAVARIRSRLSWAIHDFFQQRGFHYVQTPIITGSDCEGAGDMFRVTTLDLGAAAGQNGAPDFSKDFFGQPAYLTVSGQLTVETYCLGLGRVYTFGPTFRSENSNTSRHMAEFWMIEPELAFADLTDNMDLAEDMIRALTRFVVDDCAEDLDLFARFVDKTLLDRLTAIANSNFTRITYTEAIKALQASGADFQFNPSWGQDLQSEHEKFLTEKLFGKPVIVYDWPRTIKAFYMRQNDDLKTVAAMDVLVPEIGELVGGSQREERYDMLLQRMRADNLPERNYWWYLETRRFGSAPHVGFGLGFERLLMLVTGISNIRDVIAFPRTPKSLEF